MTDETRDPGPGSETAVPAVGVEDHASVTLEPALEDSVVSLDAAPDMVVVPALEIDRDAMLDRSTETVVPPRRSGPGSGLGVAIVVGLALVLGGAGVLLRAELAGLWGPPPMVSIEIDGAPAGATVTVDGEVHGERPVRVPRSEEHLRVKVEAAGFEPKTIQVKPATDRTLQAKLEPTD